MLTAKQVTQAAKALYEAEEKNEPTTPTSEKFPDADVEDAYRISQAVTELKLKAGRTIKGHKIGLTSKAMRSITGADRARLRNDVRQLVRRARAASCPAAG